MTDEPTPPQERERAREPMAMKTPAHKLIVEKCWKPDCRAVAVVKDGCGWAWCADHVDQEGVVGIHAAVEHLDVDYYQNRAARVVAAVRAEATQAERERCAKIAEREPELPGEPDAETRRAMIEAGPVANARAATAATKKAIAAAIREGK